LGTLMQFFLVAGFLLEYIVGPSTSYVTLAIVSLATPVICFGMFMWMPDSPQSLLVRPGGEQKAMESLRWLRGNPQETTLIKELDDIKVTDNATARVPNLAGPGGGVSFVELFSHPTQTYCQTKRTIVNDGTIGIRRTDVPETIRSSDF